jgi:hypothetical protein
MANIVVPDFVTPGKPRAEDVNAADVSVVSVLGGIVDADVSPRKVGDLDAANFSSSGIALRNDHKLEPRGIVVLSMPFYGSIHREPLLVAMAGETSRLSWLVLANHTGSPAAFSGIQLYLNGAAIRELEAPPSSIGDGNTYEWAISLEVRAGDLVQLRPVSNAMGQVWGRALHCARPVGAVAGAASRVRLPKSLSATAAIAAADLAAAYTAISTVVNGQLTAANLARLVRIPNALKNEPRSQFPVTGQRLAATTEAGTSVPILIPSGLPVDTLDLVAWSSMPPASLSPAARPP